MTDEILLALDFGGSKLSAAVARVGDTTWSALQRTPTPPGHDADYERREMSRLGHEVLGKHRPRAVGISFGGPVRQADGLVILSQHVRGWDNMPLVALVQAEYGAPVAMANDANAGALGEWHFGAGRGCASLLYVTVSTGIGGGWVINGAIFDGADGMAGEIGHTVVEPGGALCPCGKHGCLEAEACGPAIARAAREQLAAHPEAGSGLRALVSNDLSALTAVHVAQAASSGDALALKVLDRAARMLGMGLGNAINLMNPERVLVGGGVTKAGSRWWNTVCTTSRYYALPQMRTDIRLATLGDDAVLWGAVALAEQRR
jgi:glucokinase